MLRSKGLSLALAVAVCAQGQGASACEPPDVDSALGDAVILNDVIDLLVPEPGAWSWRRAATSDADAVEILRFARQPSPQETGRLWRVTNDRLLLDHHGTFQLTPSGVTPIAGLRVLAITTGNVEPAFVLAQRVGDGSAVLLVAESDGTYGEIASGAGISCHHAAIAAEQDGTIIGLCDGRVLTVEASDILATEGTFTRELIGPHAATTMADGMAAFFSVTTSGIIRLSHVGDGFEEVAIDVGGGVHAIAAASTDRVAFSGPGDFVVMSLEGGEWVISTVADPEAVTGGAAKLVLSSRDGPLLAVAEAAEAFELVDGEWTSAFVQNVTFYESSTSGRCSSEDGCAASRASWLSITALAVGVWGAARRRARTRGHPEEPSTRVPRC